MSEINYEGVAAKFIVKGIHVFEKGTTGYNDSVRHILQSSSQEAAFAVQPFDLGQLVETIKILGENKVPFAIKGGGSSRKPGVSSTKGVQIYMTFFDKITLSQEKDYIDVGAGCLWDRVYAVLQDTGKNVVGGTGSNRGVAGFLLGGGYSLKSNKHGLAIDHILEMEVVLPGGRVMTVKEEGEGSDLFEALKGGGNNFGIVTRFKLRTHDQGPVWGQTFVFENGRESEVTTAIDTFIREEIRREQTFREVHSEAALIASFRSSLHNGQLKDSISIMCVYDGPRPNRSPWASFVGIDQNVEASKKTKQINAVSSDIGQMSEIKSYTEINAMASDLLPAPQNPDTRGLLGCIMVHSYTKTFIDAIASERKVVTQDMEEHGGRLILFQVQPVAASIFHNMKPAAWPRASDHPLGPLIVHFLWTGEDHDIFWLRTMKRTLDNLKKAAIKEGCTDPEAPLSPHTAIHIASVRQIYRTNLEKFIGVRQKYAEKHGKEDVMNLVARGPGIPIGKPMSEESCRLLLKLYDTVVIVDDSLSMCNDRPTRWADAQIALEEVVRIAVRYDSDGIDLLFLNSDEVGEGLKDPTQATSICEQVQPNGGSRLGDVLRTVLDDYLQKIKDQVTQHIERADIKGLNLIVITDGELDGDVVDGVEFVDDGPAPETDLASIITQTAEKLRDNNFSLRKIGINFVQVGNSTKAAKLLSHLDDDIGRLPGKQRDDLVDYTLYIRRDGNEELLDKILLGGINKKFDDK